MNGSVQHPARASTRPPRLAPRAAMFLAAVTAAAAAAVVAATTGSSGGEPWLTFVLLASGAAAAQLLVVPTGQNHGFQTATVFVVAAALLLPPQLVALIGVAQHGPEGLRKRYPWYIQVFNGANGTLNALGAWCAAYLVRASGFGGDENWALAAVAAAAAFVLLNHLLLAVMLLLARGHSVASSGLFSLASLGLELVPAGLGIGFAALWQTHAWLVPVTIAPLLLSHRMFVVLARLRESEDRFRAMFESAAVGAALMDLDGRLLSTNRALDAMLRRSKADLAGIRLADVTHPDDRAESEAALAALSAGARSEFHCEQQYLGGNDEVVWGNTAVAVVRDADDRPQYAIAMIEDATERKSLQLELQQAQKMEAIGRLAGGVAHDFNNMLTAITGYTAMSLCRLDNGLDVSREDLDEVQKAADRAATLTRQLLAFSRKQVLQPRVTYLNDVVADVDAMLRRLIGEDVAIDTRLGAEIGRIKADTGQLQQVLLNLVVNARDAMPNGGRIVIETADAEVRDGERRMHDLSTGHYVTLSVTDEGCGMPPSTLERIFEPFFTTKDIGAGTGLGLATVYGIVTQSGATIDVESAVGRGSTFRIWFPRVDEPVATADVAAGPGGANGAETVLLVEDEDAVRAMLRDFLRASGYTVLDARNGADALRLRELHRERIDVTVTDVVMPEMSGFELAARIRDDEGDAPILFISGYTGAPLLERELGDGETLLLQKPFPPQVLAQKLREILDEPRPLVAA